MSQHSLATNPTLPPHCDGVSLNLQELMHYRSQSVRWLPPARNIWAQISGTHSSRSKGRGMDFAEVRQYQAGDDIRSIDWRVTARTGKAHTKLFTEDKEQPVILYLDLNDSQFFGSRYVLKSVQMAHFASVLIWLTLANKDRIGAVIETQQQRWEFVPSSRPKHAMRILQTLIDAHNHIVESGVQTTPTQRSLSDTLQAIDRVSPKGSEIIMMSDLVRWEQQDKNWLTRLSQHNSLRMVHFYDPLELGNTAYRGHVSATNGHGFSWLNLGSKKQRKMIEDQFSSHQNQIKQVCQGLGISFTPLSSGQPLIEQINQSYNK